MKTTRRRQFEKHLAALIVAGVVACVVLFAALPAMAAPISLSPGPMMAGTPTAWCTR